MAEFLGLAKAIQEVVGLRLIGAEDADLVAGSGGNLFRRSALLSQLRGALRGMAKALKAMPPAAG